jgi:hypothetical protein
MNQRTLPRLKLKIIFGRAFKVIWDAIFEEKAGWQFMVDTVTSSATNPSKGQ